MTQLAREQELQVAIHADRTSQRAAAAQYGISPRQVSRIVARWQNTTEFRIARARLIAQLADQYANLEQLWIDRMETALRDPKTPIRDIVPAGKVLAEQRQLASGDVTSRSETVTEERTRETAALESSAAFLRAIVDATDDERRQYLAEHGIDVLRNIAESESDRVQDWERPDVG